MVYEDVLRYIYSCGSDNVTVFGGLYEGGYHIQQVPEELAHAIVVISRYRTKTYLEIGAAAGGTARVFWDFGIARDIFIIDDNRHPKAFVRKIILPMAHEWIGNSQSIACYKQLEQWDTRFDLVFVDADHSYDAVRHDCEMVLQFMSSPSILMLHDTIYCDGPKRMRDEINAGRIKKLKEIAHCGNRLGLTLFFYCPD